jgi:SAM-dependent methyltransferase
MDFSRRSYEKELLDRNDIPFEDIRQNMKELDYINTKLGGHNITLQGIKAMMKNINNRLKDNGRKISIVEIGCGGGDNLRVIRKYCEKKNVPVELTGVDINPHCIEFARARKENAGIEFITSDYELVKFRQKPDIIFSSLFCHHFTDEGVVNILKWMKENSATGFFINDLHRHALAYYSIKWLTKFFSKSYLVKNDAPLSVMRGFKKSELKMFRLRSLLPHQSNNEGGNFQVKWKWAFRWLLICTHE